MSYSFVFYGQYFIDKKKLNLILMWLNYANTLGLCIEEGLKIYDSGIKSAVRDNTYQMSICLLSLVDILLEVVCDKLHVQQYFV